MSEPPATASSPPEANGRRTSATRRVVAFLGHAPGLWLVYRATLPRRLWRANVVAAAATVAAAGMAVAVARRERRGGAALAAWAIGHVLWGSYLARHLEPPSP